MSRWMPWALGGVLLVAAWGVTLVTPDELIREAPFVVTTSIGDHAEGRNIAVRVDEARWAETVTAGGWSASGNWLVVDLEVSSVASEFGISLERATLELDGVTYGASDRPESLLGAGLHAGVPQTGSVAFELPDDVSGGAGALRFSTSEFDRLDSVIEVPVVLDAFSEESSAELLPTEWSDR